MSGLLSERTGHVLHLRLNRPEVRNALNAELIRDLTAAFEGVKDERCVVLTGAGRSFCAGGDLQWMQSSVNLSEEENLEDARKLGRMFEAIDACPCPVVASVHDAVFGGGIGIVAACDVVFAAEGTRFSFSEVKLGLAPSVISRYALRKIGESAARRYFLTAEVFGAEEAQRIGLVHEAMPHDHLRAQAEEVVRAILLAGPQAVRAAKSLVREQAPAQDSPSAADRCAALLARLRVSEEGQEGVKAFLEKRPAAWATESG